MRGIRKAFLIFGVFACLTAWASDETRTQGTPLITVDFKEADLANVLRLLSDQYGVNIVAGEQVKGAVTVRLNDVTLEGALNAILLSNGYGYIKEGNIYRVAPLAQLAEDQKAKSKLTQYELATEVIQLRYLDAQDARRVLKGMLSSRGKIRVLERKTLPGWQIAGVPGGASATGGSNTSASAGGTGTLFQSGAGTSSSGGYGGLTSLLGQRAKPVETYERSRTLVVTDTPSRIEAMKMVLEKVDISPQQVIIDAMVVELSLSNTEDLGLKWESLEGWAIKAQTGQSLTDEFNRNRNLADTLETTRDNTLSSSRERVINNLSGNASSDLTTKTGTSSESAPETHTIGHTKTADFTNLRTLVLSTDELRVVLSALAKRGDVDIISNPNVLTLDNHEATILVGENFPIFAASVSEQGTVTESLQYYQPVGISLRVIPQVSANRHINMLIHPSVSEVGEFVTGTTGLQYPRIHIREADTQVLVEEGQTVVIGGLVTGHDEEVITRVPLLGDIPLLGLAFRHKSMVRKKVNLMVFVTPRLIRPDEISDQESIIFKRFLQLRQVELENRKKPRKFFSPPNLKKRDSSLVKNCVS